MQSLELSTVDSYEKMKSFLSKELFSIELINKNINKSLLSMAYSPGVGAVCMAIVKDPLVTDTTTLRSRSLVVLTDGSYLETSADGVAPAVDWIVAQVKSQSGLDPFPFIVSSDINLEEALIDFATSYTAVLYLDNKDLGKVPENLTVLRHQDVVSFTKSSLTDAESSAKILAYLIKKNIKGLASKESFEKGILFQTDNFKTYKPYKFQTHDGRDIYAHSMQLHEYYTGKIQIQVHFYDINKLKPYFTEQNLRRLSKQHEPFAKSNRLSAIVSDGTAVLGFGNIGPQAGLPVMQGKSLLFKLLGDVEVVPICIVPRKTAQQEIVAIKNMLLNFDAVNLEDIKAPECFDIEEGINKLKLFPVFHDDQHGTAIVTLAGLINAVKVVEKDMRACKVVINGAGAAGITIAKLLLHYGVKNVIVCDTAGVIYKGRPKNMNHAKDLIAEVTNLENNKGTLNDVIVGADIFIGVSVAKALSKEQVASMNTKSIVFALANPTPQILPEEAKQAGAWIYGSGRSDFENQINNSLVFPGVFSGITTHRIKYITFDMKIKASEAIAASIQGPPSRGYIIPDSLDKDVAIRISRELGKIDHKH